MWSTRTLCVAAIAALLSIPIAAPVSAASSPAEPGHRASAPGPAVTSRGVTGPVVTIDQADLAGVACSYAGQVSPTLTEIRALAPDIRWPDRRRGDPDERGRVTWRVIVEWAPQGVEGPWKRLGASKVRRGIAHERTGATLASVRVPVAVKDMTWVRVIHQVTWLRRDGRVLGRLRRLQISTSWLIDGLEVWVAQAPCSWVLQTM